MANGKTMQAVVNLAGSIDPSLGKAIEQAQKKISGLNVKALAVVQPWAASLWRQARQSSRLEST